MVCPGVPGCWTSSEMRGTRPWTGTGRGSRNARTGRSPSASLRMSCPEGASTWWASLSCSNYARASRRPGRNTARPCRALAQGTSRDRQDAGGAEIDLISLEKNFETASAAGELVFYVFATIAHFERPLNTGRTTDGPLAARKRGRTPGRPSFHADTVSTSHEPVNNGTSVSVAAKYLGIERSTEYRVIQKTRSLRPLLVRSSQAWLCARSVQWPIRAQSAGCCTLLERYDFGPNPYFDRNMSTQSLRTKFRSRMSISPIMNLGQKKNAFAPAVSNSVA